VAKTDEMDDSPRLSSTLTPMVSGSALAAPVNRHWPVRDLLLIAGGEGDQLAIDAAQRKRRLGRAEIA